VSVEDRLAALEARVLALEDADLRALAKENPAKASAVRALGLRVADFDRAYLFYVTPRTEVETVRCLHCGTECARAQLPRGLVHAPRCPVGAG
jgi:hypothetical protein